MMESRIHSLQATVLMVEFECADDGFWQAWEWLKLTNQILQLELRNACRKLESYEKDCWRAWSDEEQECIGEIFISVGDWEECSALEVKNAYRCKTVEWSKGYAAGNVHRRDCWRRGRMGWCLHWFKQWKLIFWYWIWNLVECLHTYCAVPFHRGERVWGRGEEGWNNNQNVSH